jgi:hypothetical protein
MAVAGHPNREGEATPFTLQLIASPPRRGQSGAEKSPFS